MGKSYIKQAKIEYEIRYLKNVESIKIANSQQYFNNFNLKRRDPERPRERRSQQFQ
jgi:hypothetical protein